MKGIYSLIFYGATILVLSSASCQKKGEGGGGCGTTIINERIDSATGPNSGVVNQALKYNLTYMIGGCEKYSGINETVNGNTRIIKVNVTIPSCPTPCPAIIGWGHTNYSFTPANPGTYYLKLLRYDSLYIIDTVVAR